MQDIGTKTNLDVTAHGVHVLVLFLFVGTNQHFIAARGDVDRRPLRPQLLAAFLQFLLDDLLGLSVFLAGIRSHRYCRGWLAVLPEFCCCPVAGNWLVTTPGRRNR